MKKMKKVLPRFRSEQEERRFWQSHDSADYFDLDKAIPVAFSRLKPTTRTISIRLSEHLLADLKVLANKRDVPYQSLIKLLLSERMREEMGRAS